MKTIFAVFAYPNNGYNHDKETAIKAGLIRDNKYMVNQVEMSQSSTSVELKGIMGQFNSVQFDFVDENGNDVNIYRMPEFNPYTRVNDSK